MPAVKREILATGPEWRRIVRCTGFVEREFHPIETQPAQDQSDKQRRKNEHVAEENRVGELPVRSDEIAPAKAQTNHHIDTDRKSEVDDSPSVIPSHDPRTPG